MAVDDSKLLAAAIVNIAEFWNMTDARLGAVLGAPVSTVRRFRLEKAELQTGVESIEVSRSLVRLFAQRNTFGGDDVSMRAWLSPYNADIATRPIDLIEPCKGLTEVGNYLDGYLDRV